MPKVFGPPKAGANRISPGTDSGFAVIEFEKDRIPPRATGGAIQRFFDLFWTIKWLPQKPFEGKISISVKQLRDTMQ
jgi:hypothetical protein